MAAEPPPPSTPAPPPQPGPSATRDEWRAWRHQQHDYWRAQRHAGGGYGPGYWMGPWNWSGGSWFWGAALLVIGAYYLLKNLGFIRWINSDVLWPLLLILLGVWLLLRRGRGWWP